MTFNVNIIVEEAMEVRVVKFSLGPQRLPIKDESDIYINEVTDLTTLSQISIIDTTLKCLNLIIML